MTSRAGDGARERAGFQELLAVAKHGDAEALEVLFQRFYPVVQRMVHRRLASDLRLHRPWLTSRFSTGDVVQEVFRSVLGRLEGFEGGSEDAFSGYLATIVRNRIVDAIRFHEAEQRDGRQGQSSEQLDLHEAGESDPGEIAMSVDELRRFRDVLGEFNERERLLLRGRFEDDEPFGALAERLGYPSYFAARRAFFAAQGRLIARLRAR